MIGESWKNEASPARPYQDYLTGVQTGFTIASLTSKETFDEPSATKALSRKDAVSWE